MTPPNAVKNVPRKKSLVGSSPAEGFGARNGKMLCGFPV